jgi:hypothetical protein
MNKREQSSKLKSLSFKVKVCVLNNLNLNVVQIMFRILVINIGKKPLKKQGKKQGKKPFFEKKLFLLDFLELFQTLT